MSRKIDMTGWTMKEHGVPDSKLIVISEDTSQKSSKGEVYWNCQCECGNLVSVKGTRLRSGATKSCGHCRAENLIGWKMWERGIPDSRWEVISREPYNDNGGRPIWICKCRCGEIRDLDRYTLLTGASKSCGCLRHEQLIEMNMNRGQLIKIGQRFGKLVALQDLGLKDYHGVLRRYTLCQCDCGSKPIEILNNTLLTGGKQSCGCIASRGENYITQLLQNNNIKYKKEYTFPDLLSKNNYYLRFDFAILSNNNDLLFLLEYDGEGHYKNPTGNWTNYTLEEIQERDRIKNKYCLAHDIILKRIPYTEKCNFTYEDIISDKYNVQPQDTYPYGGLINEN